MRTIPLPGESGERARQEILRRATTQDGAAPFNEQTELDLAARRRTLRLVEDDHGEAVALIVTGAGELDLVVDPRHRRRGLATWILEETLPALDGPLGAWSHGDHPAAAALASRHGFERVRTLLRLARPLAGTDGERSPKTTAPGSDGILIEAFRAGDPAEEKAWVALNARIFHSHPEQGRVSLDDLHDRMAEPWFDAGDFLVARDRSGQIVGYDWTKAEPGEADGEIYVLGVAAEHAGQGLGTRLLDAGLARLAGRGRTRAVLYVEGDNAAALHVYRAAGFTDDLVDARYQRGNAVA